MITPPESRPPTAHPDGSPAALMPKALIESVAQAQSILESMSLPCIRMAFFGPKDELAADDLPSVLASRVLGPGYWEAGRAWPCSRDAQGAQGAPMALLLQINWEDVDAVARAAGLGGYAVTGLALPARGITQIYLDQKAAGAGADKLSPAAQKTWRLVHWEAPSIRAFSMSLDAPGMIDPMFPAEAPARIAFSVGQSRPSLSDQLTGLRESDFAPGVYERLLGTIDEDYGSRIGGYPSFVEHDSRLSGEIGSSPGPVPRLLMQISSDSPINWGEDGQAHWFVDPTQLQIQGLGGALRVSYSCEQG